MAEAVVDHVAAVAGEDSLVEGCHTAAARGSWRTHCPVVETRQWLSQGHASLDGHGCPWHRVDREDPADRGRIVGAGVLGASVAGGKGYNLLQLTGLGAKRE